MDDYKPNSHRFREEQKTASTERQKVQKVVKGTVKTKKKNELRKLSDVFISEDVHNVKNYIFMDVLVPAIKNAIEDVVINGIRMVLRGETSARKSGSGASKVSYTKYYDGREEDRRYNSNRTRSGYSYDEIIIPTRGEAEEVLTRMDELIDNYGIVSVADLYDLVGITGNYTDNKYGWTNVRNAEAVRVREGYLLKLPKALPLN